MSRKAIFKGCVVLVCLGICGISFGQYGGGSGTEASPYLIYTAEQLNAIGAHSGDWAKRFKVMTDIDLSAYKGTQFNRIGTDYDHTFKGVLDGNGHTISNFTYDSNSTDYVGLVGYLMGKVKDMGLVGICVTGRSSVGGLVGCNSYGTVTNCYSSGFVSGIERVGGLVGDNSDGTVTNCYSSGSVLGMESVGGLVGWCNYYGTIANGYASGSVSGTESVGGLVGYSYGIVSNCYSSGSVSGSKTVGGLVGSGIVGAVNSFWDIQTSGQTASAGGGGRTTQQMWLAGTYMGWNSDGHVDWVIDEDKDYPRLAWEGRPGQPISTYNLTDFVTGSGTADDPYLISTAEQYNSIGCFPSQWGKQYRLVADIDLAGTEPVVIGVSYLNPFTGVLDGNGHTISNFTYDSNSMSYIGLVGYLGKGGVVKDLGLVGVHVTGYSFVGGLVGYNYYGIVTNCYSSGSVSGTERVGGLVGFNDPGTVTNCYSSGSVSGWQYVGGLVGYSYGAVSNCYSSGSVSGTEHVGGLVGQSSGTVTNCYSIGSVLGTESIGGLVGSGYAAVNSFWDIQTSGQTVSAGGRGRTTQQMWQVGTYVGWNSDGLVDWGVDEDKDYPRLVWEGRPGQPIPTYTLSDFLAGAGTTDDPYLISTEEQFNSIGCFPFQWGKQYRLVVDIDLAGIEFVEIGVSYLNPFTGVLDGNGHTISNFTYDSNSMSDVGLVGYLNGGVVKDLGLVGVRVTGRSNVGGLVGCNYYGRVSNCYSSGSVSGTERVGGLVGYNSDGTVTNCYSFGSVSGTSLIGGLVGSMYWGTVTNCYSSGSVSGDSSVGGLVGSGYYSTRVRNSFWDVQTSGQTGSSGGTGKTMAQMQDINTYLPAGWDFVFADNKPSDIWTMPSGGGYPILWWQVDPLPALPAFGGGYGTREDPYLIADTNQLNHMGSNPRLMDRCFKLVQDIDLLGMSFYIIGDVDNPFMGVFEGDGHTISNLVYKAGSYYVGLFSCVGQTGEVRNLTLSNVHVIGYCYVGSLAGKNEGLVSGCQATGTVSGYSDVGGLIGWNRYGTVSECSATVKTSGDLNVGDLIGRNDMPEL